MATFRIQAKALHLTYKTWLSEDDVHALTTKVDATLVQLSWCHENGHTDTPYEHTHVYIEWAKICETTNQRFFDIRDIHPHIKTVDLRGKKHKRRIMRYHQKEGVMFKQIPEWSEPCGAEKAIEIADDNDVLGFITKISDDGPVNFSHVSGMEKFHQICKRKRFADEVQDFEPSDFRYPKPEGIEVAFVKGPSEKGKTEWVKTWFKHPIIIRNMDDLKDKYIIDYHDGIIFDDMKFTHIPEQGVQNLLEWTNHCTIHCRHFNAFIPARTPKVFTTNYEPWEVFGEETWAKDHIQRRMKHIFYIENVMFTQEAIERHALTLNGVPRKPKIIKLE